MLDIVNPESLSEVIWRLVVGCTPAALAVLLEELVKLVVEVHAEVAHVVMIWAKLDPASFVIGDLPSAVSAVYVMPYDCRVVTDETTFASRIQAWLLAHIDPVPIEGLENSR
jgi:hypothetical protein